MTAAEVACNHFGCDSQPGEPCLNEDKTPFLVEGKDSFHAERTEQAGSMTINSGGVPITKEQFDAAVSNVLFGY